MQSLQQWFPSLASRGHYTPHNSRGVACTLKAGRGRFMLWLKSNHCALPNLNYINNGRTKYKESTWKKENLLKLLKEQSERFIYRTWAVLVIDLIWLLKIWSKSVRIRLTVVCQLDRDKSLHSIWFVCFKFNS